MKLQVMYVNSDLVYEEKTVSSTNEALPLLEELMNPGMSAKLLDGENKELKSPKMPCAIINCEYADGKTTLNIYPEGDGFIAVWAMDAPRWNFLKFIKKNYMTKAKDISAKNIKAELSLLNVSCAAEFMEHSKSGEAVLQ